VGEADVVGAAELGAVVPPDAVRSDDPPEHAVSASAATSTIGAHARLVLEITSPTVPPFSLPLPRARTTAARLGCIPVG
jgi:hypothetical protein